MAINRSNLVDPFESDFIKFLLNFRGQPREVKAGLQRLCAHYDSGRRLLDPHGHRLLVRALIWDADTLVRRWSYKAIAMIGERNDSALVAQRLRTEKDLENQTWGIAAIIRLATDMELHQVCADTGLERSVPLILAARLFAHKRWLQLNAEPPIVNIEREEALTLKWAALLSGYGRAPANLFHPQYENRILLSKLNAHPIAEVSEYSVWALCQNPEYTLSDLGMSVDSAGAQPENVRRWINRLVTKDIGFVGVNLDLFDDLRRDAAFPAREGLALGMRDAFVAGIDRLILDWHSDEADEIIRDLLLEHMAHGASNSVDYCDIVERSFTDAGARSSRRQRLLAASEQTKLFASLRRIQIREEAGGAGLFGNSTLINVEGDLVMNKTTFNAGRDIVGQNLVGGDMVGSANQAVQGMTVLRDSEKAVLSEILKFLEDKQIAPTDKGAVSRAVEAVAKDGSLKSKNALIETLKTLKIGAAAVAGIADQADKFIHTVSGWLT